MSTTASNGASASQQSMTAPTPSSDPTQLPPEALDLAAKLFNFARAGETDDLAPYVTAGIPPNLTNHEGNTLLMLAAYNGHPDTVTMLLGKGADANVLNGRGQSPLAGAVFKGYDEVVKVLVDAGADMRLGQPSAIDCARMFKRGEALVMMGIAEEA